MNNIISTNFPHYLQQLQDRVNQSLKHYFEKLENRLVEAMHYVVFNGGKRLRPLLVYATGEALGMKDFNRLDPIACAIELIHTYSLIHDDLPAMDNDALRRGKPTCHIIYGDATAILAGDALHSLAIEALTQEDNRHLNPETRLRLLSILAKASGTKGMAGGQVLDLETANKTPTVLELEQIYQLKTTALITASIQMAASASENCNEMRFAALTAFAKKIGLAFQIYDDVLDLEVTTKKLGKPQCSDLAQNKATYPLLFGVPLAKQRIAHLYQQAIDYLAKLDSQAQRLRELAHYMISRDF